MPVFNEYKHLEVCLDSIVKQSEENWELIAVDDFSDDDSWKILERYASKDTRIKIFKNKTKGIIPALELAYAQSKGYAITRMDADDKMHPKKLEMMAKLLGLNPKACITTKVEYFAEYELADGFLRYANWLNELTLQENHYDSIYKECVVASPCWMMNRNTLDMIGGICNDRYPEDYDMVFRLYEHQVKIKGVSKVLHYWRDHDARASRNDPNYASQDFVELKLHYLLKCEGLKTRPVILWGAGGAGKLWAKALIKKGIDFQWVTENEKKIGKDIYGVLIEHAENIALSKDAVLLLAIKAPSFYEEKKKLISVYKKKHRLVDLY